MANKPNIYDVAKLANVSHQTVSRVINQSQKLRPETRERVLAAMQTLGYVPSAAARALVTSKSKMIGILVTDSIYYGPAHALNAMQLEARANGYFAIAVTVDPTDTQSVDDGIAHLRQLNIDGLLVISPQNDFVEELKTGLPNIPVVYLDSPAAAGQHAIALDNYTAARIATRHLIELGHRNLLHISGTESWFAASSRRKGFLDEAQASDATVRVVAADWSIEAGYRIGSEFDLASGVTAIFAGNDHLALGLLRAFAVRKIHVPHQVSVVGFDDIPEAAYFEPPLSTMAPNFAELGRAAMGIMLGTLNESTLTSSAALIPELVVRESTARISSPHL